MKVGFVKQKYTKYIALVVTIFFLGSLLLTYFISPTRVAAIREACDPSLGLPTGLNVPFGGKICIVTLEFCLIPAPPPVFIIPYPFLYIEVGNPRPAKLYYIYGIPGLVAVSKLYREYSLLPTAWTLGTYIPGLDKLRALCLNGALLPDADGVIRIVGTSKVNPGSEVNAASAAIPVPALLNSKNFPDLCQPNTPKRICVPKQR